MDVIWKPQHVLLLVPATFTWHFSIIQCPAQWPLLIHPLPLPLSLSRSLSRLSEYDHIQRHKLRGIKEQTDQRWLIPFDWSSVSKPRKTEGPPAPRCALQPAAVSAFHLNYSAHFCTRDSDRLRVYDCADGARGDEISCERCLHNLTRLNTIWFCVGVFKECEWSARPGVLGCLKGHYALYFIITKDSKESPSSHG